MPRGSLPRANIRVGCNGEDALGITRPTLILHRLAGAATGSGTPFFSSVLAGSFFGGIQAPDSTTNMTTPMRMRRTSIAVGWVLAIERHGWRHSSFRPFSKWPESDGRTEAHRNVVSIHRHNPSRRELFRVFISGGDRCLMERRRNRAARRSLKKGYK